MKSLLYASSTAVEPPRVKYWLTRDWHRYCPPPEMTQLFEEMEVLMLTLVELIEHKEK